MHRWIFAGCFLVAALAPGCSVDARDGGAAESTAVGGLVYGGAEYGGAGVVRYRGGGSVKDCIAGPMGVLLPNRFVSCYCDQLVKDCGQDTTCTTCNNTRRQDCASTRWFSSVSYLAGSCNVSELNDCEQYCQQNCAASCAME